MLFCRPMRGIAGDAVTLRPDAAHTIAALILAAAALTGSIAVAEPLDKESCANLQRERKVLFNADMQAALDQGPDWVKKHLTEDAIEGVRRFLSIEEQIQFRCRGGGVAKTDAKSTDTKATDTKATDVKATDVKANDAKSAGAMAKDAVTVPLPDRKPTPPSAQGDDGKPSQALADSAKTPPGKAKATR
jgi:hypothetical protein